MSKKVEVRVTDKYYDLLITLAKIKDTTITYQVEEAVERLVNDYYKRGFLINGDINKIKFNHN
jgi:predicted DNA-binding protein